MDKSIVIPHFMWYYCLWGRVASQINMKKITIIAAIVAVIAVAIFAYLHKSDFGMVEIVNTTTTETVEVTVNELEKMIQDAKTASSSEIEVRARNAYEATKKQAELEVELSVRAEYRKQLEAEENKLMEEVSF